MVRFHLWPPFFRSCGDQVKLALYVKKGSDPYIPGGAGSRGMQTLIPPKTAEVTSNVTVAFAGHQIQECREGNSWELEGTHALSKGVPLGPSTFQFGYELEGGVFE